MFDSNEVLKIIGAVRTKSGFELFYARQKIVLVAKAFGLQAIDMVSINYKDIKQLQVDCEEGAKMGYTGMNKNLFGSFCC